jgi:transposase
MMTSWSRFFYKPAKDTKRRTPKPTNHPFYLKNDKFENIKYAIKDANIVTLEDAMVKPLKHKKIFWRVMLTLNPFLGKRFNIGTQWSFKEL